MKQCRTFTAHLFCILISAMSFPHNLKITISPTLNLYLSETMSLALGHFSLMCNSIVSSFFNWSRLFYIILTVINIWHYNRTPTSSETWCSSAAMCMLHSRRIRGYGHVTISLYLSNENGIKNTIYHGMWTGQMNRIRSPNKLKLYVQ